MKGALAPETLTVIIILLVALVILLWGGSAFGDVLKGAAGKSQCSWSFFLSSETRFLGVAGIPPECEMKKTTITWAGLEAGTANARSRIQFFERNPEFQDYASYFIENKNKEHILEEYVLDEIIANEMKGCTDKVLNYKFPLFDEWWKLWKWEGTPPETTIQALTQWIPRYNKPPVFCVVCARYLFDEEVQQNLNQPIASLPSFMLSNPAPYDQKNRNYLDYITDPESSGYFTPAYQFDTQKPWAVVYARVNTLKGFTWAANAVNTITWPITPVVSEETIQPLNTMNLIPYNDVSSICNYAIS